MFEYGRGWIIGAVGLGLFNDIKHQFHDHARHYGQDVPHLSSECYEKEQIDLCNTYVVLVQLNLDGTERHPTDSAIVLL